LVHEPGRVDDVLLEQRHQLINALPVRRVTRHLWVAFLRAVAHDEERLPALIAVTGSQDDDSPAFVGNMLLDQFILHSVLRYTYSRRIVSPGGEVNRCRSRSLPRVVGDSLSRMSSAARRSSRCHVAVLKLPALTCMSRTLAMKSPSRTPRSTS